MKYIELGQIVNTHALKGNVKVNVFSENVKNIKKYKNIYLKENDKYIEYEVLDIKFSKNQAIINFKNIDNKEKAEKLKNKYIYIKKEDLKKLEDDNYYLIDLINSKVYEKVKNKNSKEKEELIGTLIEVNQNAPTDIYVIKTIEERNINNKYMKNILMIPAVKEYIKEVDVKNKKIIVDLR